MKVFKSIKEHEISIISVLASIIALLSFLALLFAIWLVVLRPDLTNPQGALPTARETITALSSAAMVFATLLLAYATFVLSRESKKQEKSRRDYESARDNRDRKIKLLSIISDWAMDVGTCALDVQISPDSDAKVKREACVNVWFRLGKTYFKKNYIRALTNEPLDPGVSSSVESLIKNITVYIYLFGKVEAQLTDSKGLFINDPEATALIDQIETSIAKGETSELTELEKYENELDTCFNKLLYLIGTAMARYEIPDFKCD